MTGWHRCSPWTAVPFRLCGASSARSMKICFVCCEYPPAPHGGIGSVTRVLGRALAVAGHEVRAIGLYSKLNGEIREEFDSGVQVWRIAMPGGRLGWARGRRQLFGAVAQWA